MLVKISNELLEKYPQMQIGYVVAKLSPKAHDPYSDSLKESLSSTLLANNITKETYENHSQIVAWRNVFKDMGKNYKRTDKRSSLEALVRRIVTPGQSMFSVNDAVDLYNSCSVLTMIPMGAYDIDKINSNICLRYGAAGEVFDGLGKDDSCAVESKHVVYADDSQVLTWLWNYRDALRTAISLDTRHAIFFMDAAYPMSHISMCDAVQVVQDAVERLGGACVTSNGILSLEAPEIEIDFNNPVKRVSGQAGLIDRILSGAVSIASFVDEKAESASGSAQSKPKSAAKANKNNAKKDGSANSTV